MRLRVVLLTLFATVLPAVAQFPEDALRLATPSIGIGPRAVGMGSAFLPVADDYTALYWNPAGLAQINLHEFNIGLSNAAYGSDATFYSAHTASSINNLGFDNLGAVLPVERNAGNFSVAFGYNRLNNFSAASGFDALNPTSSLAGFEASNYKGDPTQSILYQTGVAGNVKGVLTTPLGNGGLKQSGTVEEGGAVHAFSIGAGLQVADGLDLGASIHLYTGTYTYQRNLKETDINNLYNARDTVNWTNVDLYQYAQNDYLTSSIGGVGATLGMLYHFQDAASLGLTVALPSLYHVHEDFSTVAQASFDDKSTSSPITQSGFDEYDVTTPFTLSGGVAVHPIRLLTISGALDYIDYTQLKFSNADASVIAYNSTMRTTFRPTYNYRLGAEYKIAPLGVGVRAGYQFFESAYASDGAGVGQKTVSFGFSMVLAHKAVLEIAYAHGNSSAQHINYDNTSFTQERVTLNNFLLSFGYRF